jgi:hypothetical protein
MWQVTLPSVTNRETWTETFSLIEDGEAFDLTNVSALVFVLRDPETRGIKLSAAWATGDDPDPAEDYVRIEEDDDGSFISIRFNDLSALCAKSYDFCLLITKDGFDLEVVGNVHVVEGRVA